MFYTHSYISSREKIEGVSLLNLLSTNTIKQTCYSQPLYALVMSMISPTSLRAWFRDVRDVLPWTMHSWK